MVAFTVYQIPFVCLSLPSPALAVDEELQENRVGLS